MANALTRWVEKALALLAPQPSRYGYWLGDPITGGIWVDGRQFGGHHGNGTFDYARAVGDGLGSSIVVACLNAIASQAPEPPPCLYRLSRTGEDERQAGHPLEVLLRRPNPFMSWELLAGYIALSEHVSGEAFLWKARANAGTVVELWPIPPGHIAPAWPEHANTRQWISHYAYRPDPTREAMRLPVEDVVHLRLNLDPDNLRRGRAPLKSVLREIYTDEEAAAFLAALLRNYGVPPVVMTPKPAAAGGPPPTQAQLDQMKAVAKQKFAGDRRGEVMFAGVPMDVTQVGYSPAQLNLDKLRLLPESRVCAVLGVPPIVASLYVGLEHATYNNTGGLREHFVESKMIPWWRLVASDLTHSLVPDFGEPGQYEIRFDLSEVRALQEDQDAKYKRAADLLSRGGITLNQLHAELSLPGFGDEGDVLYLPINVSPTRPEDLLTLAEPAPEPEPAALPLPPPQATLTEVPPEVDQQKVLPSPQFKAQAVDAVYQRALLRQRDAFGKRLEGEVAAYFRALAGRAERRFTAGQKAAGDAELLPESEVEALTQVLQATAQAVGAATFELAADRLGVAIAWDLQNPQVVAYLGKAGERVGGILDHTRQELRAALQEGEAAGEGISQLAKRVRAVVEETYKGRAEAIARTETGISQNRAAVLGYRESGVVASVRILDGDQHDDACKAVNGTVQTLDWLEANPLQHPRCVRAGAPIVSGGQ